MSKAEEKRTSYAIPPHEDTERERKKKRERTDPIVCLEDVEISNTHNASLSLSASRCESLCEYNVKTMWAKPRHLATINQLSKNNLINAATF